MLKNTYGAGAGTGALLLKKLIKIVFKSVFKILIYFSYGAGAGAGALKLNLD